MLTRQKQSPGSVLLKKVFLKNSPATLLKRLWQRSFPVNSTKFLRALFLHNTSGRLLLTRERLQRLIWMELKSKHKTNGGNKEEVCYLTDK